MENTKQLILFAIFAFVAYFTYQKVTQNNPLRPKFVISPKEIEEHKAIISIVGGPYTNRLELFFSGADGAINENNPSDLNMIILCINKMTPHQKYITTRYILNIIESYTIATKNEIKNLNASEYTDVTSNKYQKFIKPWIFPLTRLRDNMSHEKRQIYINKELERIGFTNTFFGKLSAEQRMYTQVAPPPAASIKLPLTTHNFTTV
jgi:hypothetical protein